MEAEPRPPASAATPPPAASADRSPTPADQREFVEEMIRQEERETALNVEQLNEMDVAYLVRKESNDRVLLVADETKERRGVTKAASKVLVHLYGQATPEASRSRSPMKLSSDATAETSRSMDQNHQNNGGSNRVTNHTTTTTAVEPLPKKNKQHNNSNHTNQNNQNNISGDTGMAGRKSSRVHHPPPRPPSFNSMDSPRGHHYHSQHWSMDEGQDWVSDDDQQETSTTLPAPEAEEADVAHQDHHHGRRREQRLESLVGYFLFGVLLGLFTA